MTRREHVAGLGLAVASGILYGSVNVASKLIALGAVAQAFVAYLAGGLVLSPNLRHLRIARKDWPYLLTMALLGAAAAPILLFYGLQRASAVDAGLLLSLEMVATAVLAIVWLKERVGRGARFGILALLGAAVLVSLAGSDEGGTTTTGILLVVGASILWGIDNAVSARLVGSYTPFQLIAFKALVGSAASGLFLLVQGDVLALRPALKMAAVGIVGIAASSLCYYFALRSVGAARTSSANVATTALVGAVGSVLLLHEPLRWLHAAAFAAVLGGLWIIAAASPLRAAPPPGNPPPGSKALK